MSQFKVGDWVVSSKSSEIFQIADMFPDGYNEYVTSIKLEPRTKWDSGIYYGQYPIEDVYLWAPSIGEWCWFWEDNSLDDYPRLGLYGHMSWSLEYWDHCEPFIGTLPTSIK